MDKRCKAYVGLTCVDGSCPVANYNYFIDNGMPDIAEIFADTRKCIDCAYYQGCEDCALADTEYCQSSKKELKKTPVKM